MATTLHPGVIPSTSWEINDQLSALLNGAAIAPLDHTGWIRVTGEDRVRWLNGMVTNSIQDLLAGQSCYNFFLNAQGRIQGDATAISLGDSILLETSREQVEKLLAMLNHFIIMDDVELENSCHGLGGDQGLLLAGPRASSLIAAIDLSSEELEPLELVQIKWFGSRIDLIRAHSPLVPRFEIWSDSETLAKVRNQLIVAGAVPVHSEALEQLRILEGTPLYGTDIRDKDLPQETAQTRALHFSKGCYLGQEIVERIHSRGNVHRTFTGFELTGALPPTGTALTSEGKAVGELTSVASIPLSTGLIQLALGYIRREALLNTAQARNLPLQYPGGTAVPVSLPYTNL